MTVHYLNNTDATGNDMISSGKTAISGLMDSDKRNRVFYQIFGMQQVLSQKTRFLIVMRNLKSQI